MDPLQWSRKRLLPKKGREKVVALASPRAGGHRENNVKLEATYGIEEMQERGS